MVCGVQIGLRDYEEPNPLSAVSKSGASRRSKSDTADDLRLVSALPRDRILDQVNPEPKTEIRRRVTETAAYRSSHGWSASSRNVSTSSSERPSGGVPGLIGRSSASVRDPRVWLIRPTTCGESDVDSSANSM